MSALLGGLTPKAFLRRHWQKRPRLIRQAFPNFRAPLTPEELAGLSCESGVEARLVQEIRRSSRWSVKSGPFKARDFVRLPRTHWTLLVQDVDKHVPAVATLLEAFRFVPDWRIDDIMISYAADGGSVGAHVDAYDVFLLQASGLRRWDISTQHYADSGAVGLPLRQVANFRTEESWLLFPGDMLYLPPGIAHHGIAVGDCMTISIGFRAPSEAEMVTDFAGLLMEQADRGRRYTDPDLMPVLAHPGELRSDARARARKMLRSRLRASDDALDIWFGRFLTEIKPWLRPVPRSRPYTVATLKRQLRRGGMLAWNTAVRRSWFIRGRTCHLFVNGRHYPLAAALMPLGRDLGDGKPLSARLAQRYLGRDSAGPILLELMNAGELRWRRL